jgi:regulator of sigma E protease
LNAIIDLFSYIGFLAVAVGLHEAGHFFAAKRFGLIAEVFSLGFGKVLFSARDRAGTSWQIRVLPFGGFVKLDEGRLAALPAVQRMAIYAAGPAVNIVLGLVLVTIAGIQAGVPVLTSLRISVEYVPTIITTLVASIGHLASGDLSQFAGPVGSAMASGDAVRLHGVVVFAALFSWSVGVLNLLPVPLLDGGQIVIAAFEMVVGKLNDTAMRYAALAGKSFIGTLIFAGCAADLIRMVG